MTSTGLRRPAARLTWTMMAQAKRTSPTGRLRPTREAPSEARDIRPRHARAKTADQPHAKARPPAARSKRKVARARAGAASGEPDFRAVADATYDWESWLGVRGKLNWVNPAVERLTGYRAEECLAMREYPFPLVHPDDHPKFREVLAAARSGTAGNDVEFRVIRKDGAMRWAAISWQTFRDQAGRRRGVRTSVRDIHERKGSEERLAEALHLVEQAAITRNEFLANMSHELRTPLQYVLGYAELLLPGEADSARAQKLRGIVDQTEHLLALIGDVLDMAALQARAPDLVLEDFDLLDKLQSILDHSAALAAQKGLALELDFDASLPRRMHGDRLRIRQIVVNLVGNALKFTANGGVRVRVHAQPLDAARVLLSIEVSDTGIGIAESSLPHIFEPFRQADPTIARRYGGTGLGLAIARKLCEAMGGGLAVRSAIGHGSTFTAQFPIQVAGRQRSLPAVERAPSLRTASPRVLVVDDAAPVRELTADMLRSLGLLPETVATGREAVAIATAQPFDLILMDLQLPDIDGLTAAQLIRAQQRGSNIRPFIVALTADSFGRARALGPSGGMDGFLVKPIGVDDLRALLKRSSSPERGPIDVVAPSPPIRVAASLDPRVLRDLQQTRGANGMTLLELTAPRVLADIDELLQTLAFAIGRGDAKATSQIAHKIRGNCLVIGATAAATLAQAVDDGAARGDLAAALEQQAPLRAACAATREAVQRALSPFDHPHGAPGRDGP